MGKPERRDPERERFWRKTLLDYRSSGVGQKEFCRRLGLNVNSLNAWARIIRERNLEEEVAKANAKQREEASGLAYWTEVLNDWRESGLTLERFAQGRKLNYRTMLRWKKQLKLTLMPSGQGRSEKTRESADGIKFAPVVVLDGQEEQKALVERSGLGAVVLEVLLRCGRVIRVTDGCRPEFLSAVASAIESC